MKVKVDLKVCGVCGDKALGYNFNAVTCESCKAFFRRNALVQKQFKCPFNDQCEITTITRRFCQKCRLDKCFAIGMCKDLIMSEEDKNLKRQKIEENRARKRTKTHGFKSGFKKVKKEDVEADSQESQGFSFADSDSSKDAGYQPNGTPTVVSVINYNDVGSERLVTSSDDVSMIRTMLNNTPNVQKSPEESTLVGLINNNDLNCNNNDPTSSSRSAVDVTKDVVEDVHRVSIEPNSIESILCEAIKLEFEAYSSIAQCHSNSRELNDAERAKLNELIVANKALLSPLDDELNNLIGSDYKFRSLLQGNPQQALETDPALVDVINLTAIVIRRLIKMAKKINAFKNMCQEDQVALLKGGCTEIMLLRSAMNYDPTKQTWKPGDVQSERGHPEAGQGQRLPRARALHQDLRPQVALRREHRLDTVCHYAVHAGPAQGGPPGRDQARTKRLLLPPAQVPGEHLPRVRSEIHIPQTHTENRGAAQVQRGTHQRLPGREPVTSRAPPHRNF
jgi:nuclear receptor subfamily 1 group I